MERRLLKILARWFLPFLLLIACDLLIYRYGLIEPLKKDHPGFLMERGLVDNDRQWFWHAASYNRTRFSFTGDTVLFRPGLFSFLALEDMAFRKNLPAQGVLSILLHAFAAYSFYLLLRCFINSGLAWLTALLFLAQYLGMEIVLWRHISPYLPALALFNLGIFFLVQYLRRPLNKFLWAAGACNFAATLFHEAVFFSLIGIGILFFLLERLKPKDETYAKSGQFIFPILILPALVYLGLSGADYLSHYPFGERLELTREKLSFIRFVKETGWFVYILLLGLFFPWAVNLKTHMPDCYHCIDISAPHAAVFGYPALIFAGCIGAGILLLSAKAVKDWSRGREEAASSVVLAWGVWLAVIIVGVSGGRTLPRGINYFWCAMYYYPLAVMAVGGILAVGLAPARFNFAAVRRSSPAIGLAIALMIGGLVSVNYSRIQKDLKSLYPMKKVLVKKIAALDQAFAAYPDGCFAGFIPLFNSSIFKGYNSIFILLWEHQCPGEKVKTPLYLIDDPQGNLWLAELSLPHLKPRDFHPLSLVKSDPALSGVSSKSYSIIKGDLPFSPINLLLSRVEYSGCDFSATISRALLCGAVFGYRNAANFQMLAVDKGRAYVRVMSDGNLSRPVNIGYLSGRQSGRLKLRVVFGAREVFLFGNDLLLTSLNDPALITGRIGFFTGSGSTVSEAQVSVNCASGEHGYFIPRVKIDASAGDKQ